MSGSFIESAEHVLPGHPDKLCDAAVDAIVDAVRRGDPKGQCGLEAACVFNTILVTGRIAARAAVLDSLDIDAIVRDAYAGAGYGVDAADRAWGPLPEDLEIATRLCFGEFEEGEREARHLSDDQAICVGYANAFEETAHLPPAVWLARKIARRLFDLRREKGAGEVGPDGKVLVTVERGGATWRPLAVSVSLNHHETSDWLLLRRLAEEAVADSCAGHPTPAITLNGAGMFVAGGPNGDNGLSGKKLVVDAYGPTIPIGGGAWSGKDLHKVDRIGGLLARTIALAEIRRSGKEEALVRLGYIPGCDRAVEVSVELDGARDAEASARWLRSPFIGNDNAWGRHASCEIPLPELARWGHQRAGAPWEGAIG